MIRERIAEKLREALNVEDIPLNIPPKPEMGDFSSAICLAIAKQRRQSPMNIAKEASSALRTKGLPDFLEEVNVSPPGYLNFKVNWPKLALSLITEILSEKKPFGKPSESQSEKVFIEHTSVNPNKAMHIGHLRNSVLGDTIANVFKWLGFETEICNYIDDTGVQVVDVVTALLYLDPPLYKEGSTDFRQIWAKAPEDQLFDYFCWDLYARFQHELEKSPTLGEKREEVLHQIEAGQNPVAFFAKELSTKIVHAHLVTVGQLFIFYDLLNWESDIIHGGFWGAAFELLKQRGALRLETEGPNEGCWVVPLGGVVETSEGVKSLDKVLVRSNGSVVYTGKDIAYQFWKFGLLKKDFLYKKWGAQPNGKMLWTTTSDSEHTDQPQKPFGHADRVINVIDVRQSYPQQVVIDSIRQAGFAKQADQSVHLAYEVVNLSAQAARLLKVDDVEEKKAVAMSGRSGTGVKANDFIEMVKQKVKEKADHALEETVANSLAAAAIRYYLLKFTVESQITFDFDEALKTTGDTGVYLEYAHARACSILRKAEENKIDLGWKSGSVPSQLTKTERNLLETLERFPAVVINASKTLRVSQLTEYAFQLASAFTDFYEHPDPDAEVQTPFIHLQNRDIQLFRLTLVRAFQCVMASVLSLLGMPELAKI